MKSKLINIFSRIIIYFVGYLFIAFGVAFSINSKLGVSPVNSIPYIINEGFSLNNLGIVVTAFFILLIILQIILLGKKFKLINLLQIGFSAIFGYFVDLTVLIIGNFTIPTYLGQLTMLLISIILIAIGVILYIGAKLIPMPAEGLVLAICEKFNFKFHNVKRCFDLSVVLIAAILSFILIGNLTGVREGTIISAFLVGTFVKYINIFYNKFIRRKNKD